MIFHHTRQEDTYIFRINYKTFAFMLERRTRGLFQSTTDALYVQNLFEAWFISIQSLFN